MKALYVSIIGILALLLSACVIGDEIESFIIYPDGTIDFSIYRLNLTSNVGEEGAREELAGYIQKLEDKRGDPFTDLLSANAKNINVLIIRRTAPASALITGRIPSLNDFAAYLSKENEVVCTPISREHSQGFQIEFTPEPSDKTAQNESGWSRADSFSETRFSLVEGKFTKAKGFLLSNDKRSALIDLDTILKIAHGEIPPITLSLEWELPEAP